MATITVQDLATELNTDPRTARKFLRSVTPADSQPGKGSRWAIEKRDIRSLRSKFTKWVDAAQEARLAKELDKSRTEEELVELTREVLTEDREPTAEELDDMERALNN